MRLVCIFSAPFLGGSELFNLEFLRVAADRDVRIHAIVPGDGTLADALRPLAHEVEVLSIPASLTDLSRFDRRLGRRAVRGLLGLQSYRRALRDAVRAREGAVCCMGFRAQLGFAATGLSRSRKTCWVVHEVVPAGPFTHLWRRAARRCEAIFTYSRAAAGQPGLRGGPTEVCDVRFDLSRFAGVPDANAPPSRLGLVGDLFELKNHLGFLEVVRMLRASGEQVEGLMIGRDTSATNPTGPYARSVRDRVDELEGAARLVEARPEEMPARFAQMDLLLHLSAVPESFGRVCVEAMAAGRPIVAFGHGAIPELVEDGHSGVLCSVGDLAGVVEAVRRLRADSAGFVGLARNARQRALERWSDVAPGRTVGHALADFTSSGNSPLPRDQELREGGGRV